MLPPHRAKEISTQFGHFDDEAREYVISWPDTLLPWIQLPRERRVLRDHLEHGRRLLLLPGRSAATRLSLGLLK